MIEIKTITTSPSQDPFSRQSDSFSQLWIDPGEMTCGVCQENPVNDIPVEEDRGWILTYPIDKAGDTKEDAGNIRNFLNSAPTQQLLDRICQGWKTAWDGQNTIGILTKEAQSAVIALLDTIEALAQNKERQFLGYDQSGCDEDESLYLPSDEELVRIAEELSSQTEDTNQDSVIELLVKWRTTSRRRISY